MRLGLILGMSGAAPRLDMDKVLEAERLGYNYGLEPTMVQSTDAITPVAWVLARTTRYQGGHRDHADAGAHPGLRRDHRASCSCSRAIAFSAASVRRARSRRGLARRAIRRPLARTREYVEIIRQLVAREAPLTAPGRALPDPLYGPGATGLAKPLRASCTATRPEDLHRGRLAGGVAHRRRGRGRNAPVFHVAGKARDRAARCWTDATAGKAPVSPTSIRPLYSHPGRQRCCGLPRRVRAATGTLYRRHGSAVKNYL